jgi:hypothetical protein
VSMHYSDRWGWVYNSYADGHLGDAKYHIKVALEYKDRLKSMETVAEIDAMIAMLEKLKCQLLSARKGISIES